MIFVSFLGLNQKLSMIFINSKNKNQINVRKMNLSLFIHQIHLFFNKKKLYSKNFIVIIDEIHFVNNPLIIFY